MHTMICEYNDGIFHVFFGEVFWLENNKKIFKEAKKHETAFSREEAEKIAREYEDHYAKNH